MKAAQDRQRSYANTRRRPLEFDVGDHVFFKVSPLKRSLRFGKKGKLTSKFIGPFEILQRVGPVTYRLALLLTLQEIHDVFHVSSLPRYIPDPSHVIQYERLQLEKNLTYIEEPIKILGPMEQTLRNKTIPFVKVLWKNHKSADGTWEPKHIMQAKYPELFITGV